VVVDHLAFGVGDCAFDGVELLGQFKATLAFGEHFDGRAKMPFRALKALHDVWMAYVFHASQ